ncbi:hypothetical protein ABIA14_001708 [Sinorhizobium fredii]|uniref:hypothetical protein n=1 Tax=Rhizobium fredii TaxID=380 RepID=UPI0035188F99
MVVHETSDALEKMQAIINVEARYFMDGPCFFSRPGLGREKRKTGGFSPTAILPVDDGQG